MTPCEADHGHTLVLRRYGRGQHVCGIARGAESEQNVAGASKCVDLLRIDQDRVEIVEYGRCEGAPCCQRHSGQPPLELAGQHIAERRRALAQTALLGFRQGTTIKEPFHQLADDMLRICCAAAVAAGEQLSAGRETGHQDGAGALHVRAHGVKDGETTDEFCNVLVHEGSPCESAGPWTSADNGPATNAAGPRASMLRSGAGSWSFLLMLESGGRRGRT